MRAGSGEYSQVMEFHPELRERLLWRLLLRRGAYCELLLKQAVLYDEGPCQACQKAGQDCVYETNQCSVDSDCVKYASNWICNPSFKCCVPPQVTTTTTTTTLAGCWSDRECVFENGPCYICPSFGSSCTLQSNQCTISGDCTIRFGKPETLPVILILGAVILRLSVRLTATVRLYMVRIGRVITVSIVPIMVQTLTVWMAPESGSVTARSRDALMGRM